MYHEYYNFDTSLYMYSEVVRLIKLVKALSKTIQGRNYNNFHTGSFQPLLRYD